MKKLIHKFKLLQDIQGAFINWRIWVLLGWQDIQLRYRRSMLGPFWLTISMAITIYSMGFLYGHLFKIDLKTYFPYLATGILGWGFISTLMIEATDVFVNSETYIKQIKLPYMVFIFRMIFRNLIIFLHNLLAFIPLIFVFNINLSLYHLLLIPILMLICINAVCYGALLAIIGTRYRDIAPIINSLIQVIFFLTPIMWMPSLLPEKYQSAIHLNPFAQFIALLRSALLGQPLPIDAVFFVGIFTLIGFSLITVLFSKVRTRIVYWL